MFLWTLSWQTSAVNWLTRFKWKEILSILGREYIVKNFEPFLRNISSNRMSYKLMTRFRPINCFLLSLFLWTPGWQTSAANWLTRFMWKEILSTLPTESIMKNFEPFWRYITSKIVMSWKLLPKMSPDHLIFYLCFYGRLADKPARPIGWLDSNEGKYCQF